MRTTASWVEALSQANLRHFAVEAEGINRASTTGDTSGLEDFLADWQATAELEDSPEVLEEIRRPKERLSAQRLP